MRVSELLDRVVVDSHGQKVGKVREVIITNGHSRSVKPFAGLRVDGLLVARHGYALHWGFDNTRHIGPLPLRALLAPRRGRALFVPWRDIATVEGTITIKIGRSDLKTLRDSEDVAR